jgi:hypothetical protein
MPGKRAADAQAEAVAGAGGGAKQARTEADRRVGGAPDAVAAGTAGTENIVLINSADGIDQWIAQNKFLGLLQSRTAIDIVFESSSNKQTLEAHRLVLAMQSPKLKELISSDLFFQPGNGNGRMSFVSMSNPVHFEALSVILDWIYKVRAHAPRRTPRARAQALLAAPPPPLAQVPGAPRSCCAADLRGGAGQVYFAARRRHRAHCARVQLHVGHGPDQKVPRGPRLCPSHPQIVCALPPEHVQEIQRQRLGKARKGSRHEILDCLLL